MLEFAIKHLPFLALPLPNLILTKIASKFAEYLVQEAEFGAFFLYIDLRSTRQGKIFEEAALKNRAAQEGGTDEEKKLAEAELISKFREFARFSS